MPRATKYEADWQKILLLEELGEYQSGFGRLTKREKEYVEHRAAGLSALQAAREMHIGTRYLWDLKVAVFKKYPYEVFVGQGAGKKYYCGECGDRLTMASMLGLPDGFGRLTKREKEYVLTTASMLVLPDGSPQFCVNCRCEA